MAKMGKDEAVAVKRSRKVGKQPKQSRKTRVETGKSKSKVGRPSDYREEFNQQAYRLALLGATDEDAAAFFGVNKSTIERWKIVHPEFCDSMVAGKEKADSEIAESLYQRAKGYSHPEVHVSNYQGEVTLTPLTKYYPPDTAAASLWLRNRQPKRWRDKVDHELYGKDGGPIHSESNVTLTPNEAYRRMLG